MIKHFFCFFLFLSVFVDVKAQDFFADEQTRDSVQKPVYQSKYHTTFCAFSSINRIGYGGSFLIHFNKERFSPYFAYSYSPSVLQKVVFKSSIKAQIKTDVSYTVSSFSFGVASSPVKQLLLYANTGFIIEKINSISEVYKYYEIQKAEDFKKVLYGGGLYYLLPFGLTFQLGAEFSRFTVITGIGYTF